MKILFIGDVVGKPGRQAVTGLLPKLKREHQLDFVIANGENSAHGAGMTKSTVTELLAAGVDIITGGDHVWDQKGFEQEIDSLPQVIRPLNVAPAAPGRGSVIVEVGEKARVGVVNVMGRVYMPNNDCPFRTVQAEVNKLRRQTSVIVVDIHAEATSEKIALGRYLDGQVSLVVGTHTHVQTADEQILPKGTAYLSDSGMCGPHDSVLGRDVEAVIRRFVSGMPQKLEVAAGKIELCGVVVEVDENTGLAQSIHRLRVPYMPT
ncbi:MAG: 2',3'-cyclic-nucleotide 2'-phosphodiesterase [Verrucomicrobiae bacterium]|nr:2',3'-cyclic-nucleotide 2'-phosphodiesterase [Verrucomicrobiae bacterium]